MELAEIWVRNSFDVEAVRVTEANAPRVAAWCGGTVAQSLDDCLGTFIVLDATHDGLVIRQVRARVGDWIVLVDGEFRVRRDKLFKLEYQPKKTTLGEHDIRRIVREEMSNLLDEARKKAGVPEHIDAERMSDALVTIIETVSEHEAIEKVNELEDRIDDK